MTSEDVRTVLSCFKIQLETSLLIERRRHGLPRNFIKQIFRNILHLFPNRLHIVEELNFKERDYESRTESASCCPQNENSNPSFLFRNISFDECVFNVDENAKKQNERTRESENSHRIRDVSCNGPNIILWRSLSIDRVIALHFFDNPIVTVKSYLLLLYSISFNVIEFSLRYYVPTKWILCTLTPSST